MRRRWAFILIAWLCLLAPNVVELHAAAAKCAENTIYSGSAISVTNSAKPTLKVVSLNMARAKGVERILKDLRDAKRLDDADVWLLQEVAQEAHSATRTVQELARVLDLNYVFAPADVLDDGDLISGLAILSRYPIHDPRIIPLSRHNVKIHNRCRIALIASLRGPVDPIQVYNVHLDTRITRQQRMDQIRPVLEAANSFRGPAMIGGDFNTTNIRWIGSLLPIFSAENHADSLRRLLEQNGFKSTLDHVSGSVRVLWITFRLDWIFSRGFQPVSAGVEDIDFSDHRAVWTEFSLP